jgi:hypothetical protein
MNVVIVRLVNVIPDERMPKRGRLPYYLVSFDILDERNLTPLVPLSRLWRDLRR